MRYMRAMVLMNDKVFQMRASEDFLRRIDDWRRAKTDIPSRAEAIRRLIEAGLNAGAEPAAMPKAKPAPKG